MMILRIMRVFFLMLLLASVEVQARILQERSHNFMVESNYGRLSTPEMSSYSTLKSSPGDVLLTIIKTPILQMVTFSCFPCVTESFSKKFNAITYAGKRPLPPPPSPKIAPPTHYGEGNEAALPYESPPNPFLASS